MLQLCAATTQKLKAQVWGFGTSQHGSAVQSAGNFFFFHSRRRAASGQDKTRQPRRWVSVRLPLLVLLNSPRRKQATAESRLRGDQWERRTGGWQACVWSRGARGNQCLDRAAVIGARPPRCDRTHLTDGSQLDVRVWLSGLGAGPGRSSAPLISFTGCVHEHAPDSPSPGNHSAATNSVFHLTTFTPGYRWQHKQWLTALYSWDSIVHRKPYNKCIYCL